MKMRPLKKTANGIQEVLRVLKETKTGFFINQRGLREPYVISEVPDGHFCVVKGRVYCPKKRGEKIHVLYSAVFEETL